MSLQVLFPSIAAQLPISGGVISSQSDFEVLGLAVEAAELEAALGGLSGFTLFAPTDQAFANLASSLGYSGDPEDADGVFGAIAGALTDLSPDSDPIPLLTDILLYHVTPDGADLDGLNSDGPVTTLLDDASFEVTGGTVVDADPDYQNADVVSADVAIEGGTIQVVDQVLLPLDAPVEEGDPTLLDVLKESGGSFDSDGTDFDLLLTALQATGLDGAVDDPDAELTVFVPNDAAFIGLAQDLGYEGDDEGEAFQAILDAAAAADPENPLGLVTEILTYHVSPGEQDSAAVLGSESLDTLQGEEIGVAGTTLVDLDMTLDDPEIIATDIEASNGIAHAIDGVLLPVDLMEEDESEHEDEDDEEDEEEEDNDNDDDDLWAALGVAGLFLGLMFLL